MNILKTIAKNILPYGIVKPIAEKRELERENNHIPISEEPPLYNENGEKLKVIFLKDDCISRDYPYMFTIGRFPKYIFWDRNNYGLKNHVYAQRNILTPIGKPIKRFAFFIESETIEPDDYKILYKHKSLANDFDLIFTHNIDYLNKFKNAVFIPSGGVYYGTTVHGGVFNPQQYKFKSKNISIVSSAKNYCELHKYRMDLAWHLKNNPNVDTFGDFDGGKEIKIASALTDYRYDIAIENNISPYRFTEKILNCFASMTIPIYIGATKIDKFFNTDGIINLQYPVPIESFDKILTDCTEENYLARLPAIVDNYNRVQQYLCIEDYIYTQYKNHFV